MIFFHRESKSKKPQKIRIYKKKKIFFFFFLFFFFFGGGRGAVGEGWGGGMVDGWTVEQAQTNLPLQLLRSRGHNNTLMYNLCP